MNRIEKLIAELCPDGVEWKKLGEVAEESRERNTNLLISDVWSVTNSHGLIRTGEFFDSVRTSKDKSNYKIVEKDMFVYNPARINVGSIARHKESFKVIVSPMYIVVKIDKSKLSPKYFELFLSSNFGKQQILNKVEVGVRFRLTYEAFANIKLPLPPLCIQEEIVKILDTFTALQAALQAELEARKKQYEYYRNKLLTPVEHNGKWYLNGVEVEWKKLGEVCEIIMGTSPEGKTISSNSTNGIEFHQGKLFFGNKFLKHSNLFTTSPIKIAKPGSILMSVRAPVGDTNITDRAVAIGRGLCSIFGKNPVQTQFIYYYLKASVNIIKRKSTGSTFEAISTNDVISLPIPLPPLSEQERIVAILDKLDALVNDLSVGLPAEIEARRKQYEYYRNKLLNFRGSWGGWGGWGNS